VHSIEENLKQRRCLVGRDGSCQVSGQLTKELRFMQIFKGSHCNRSFDSSRDFIPLSWGGGTVAEGLVTRLGIHLWDLKLLI